MSKKDLDGDELEYRRIVADREAALQKDHGNARTRSSLKAAVRNQAFLNGLQGLLAAHPLPRALPYRGKKAKRTQRLLNLMLSDLHYGSDITAEETGDLYGPTEEARRTAAVVTTAADWKRQYRGETTLYVHLLGDIIEGKLHDVEAAAPLTEQFQRALWNLGQALRFLASEFQAVHVSAVPGNHGRHKIRHPDRAVNQKWDSIENMLYSALKMHVQAACPNVTFDIPLTPYYTYNAFDRKGWMTHGDTVLNVGYPNKAINIDSLQKQVLQINAGEIGHGRAPCDLFGAGHVHIPSATRIPSSAVIITNGCLVPSGSFGQSIGLMQASCCQQIWESVPGIIYGHRMDILVGADVDKDADFDRVVKPYQSPALFGGPGGHRGE